MTNNIIPFPTRYKGDGNLSVELPTSCYDCEYMMGGQLGVICAQFMEVIHDDAVAEDCSMFRRMDG